MGSAFSHCILSAWQNVHLLLRNIWFMNENKPSNAREKEDGCDQHVPLVGGWSKVPNSTSRGRILSGESARQRSLWNDKQIQASQGYSRIHSLHSHSFIFVHFPSVCSPSLSRPCAYARQASPTCITESFVHTSHL